MEFQIVIYFLIAVLRAAQCLAAKECRIESRSGGYNELEDDFTGQPVVAEARGRQS